uniref:Uncharacterized protein n=1 Tax=Anguilla anguilla TaxID=7936 RepID=A0A0E9XRX0_ANGAN
MVVGQEFEFYKLELSNKWSNNHTD